MSQSFPRVGRTEKELPPPISVHPILDWVEADAKNILRFFWQKEIKIFCSFAAINVRKARGNPQTALRFRKTLDFRRLQYAIPCSPPCLKRGGIVGFIPDNIETASGRMLMDTHGMDGLAR